MASSSSDSTYADSELSKQPTAEKSESKSWTKKLASLFESPATKKYDQFVQPKNEPEYVNGKKMVRYNPAQTQAYGDYYTAKGGRF
jgi:hypothetical protein